jgi:hypothetical protein
MRISLLSNFHRPPHLDFKSPSKKLIRINKGDGSIFLIENKSVPFSFFGRLEPPAGMQKKTTYLDRRRGGGRLRAPSLDSLLRLDLQTKIHPGPWTARYPINAAGVSTLQPSAHICWHNGENSIFMIQDSNR